MRSAALRSPQESAALSREFDAIMRSPGPVKDGRRAEVSITGAVPLRTPATSFDAMLQGVPPRSITSVRLTVPYMGETCSVFVIKEYMTPQRLNDSLDARIRDAKNRDALELIAAKIGIYLAELRELGIQNPVYPLTAKIYKSLSKNRNYPWFVFCKVEREVSPIEEIPFDRREFDRLRELSRRPAIA